MTTTRTSFEAFTIGTTSTVYGTTFTFEDDVLVEEDAPGGEGTRVYVFDDAYGAGAFHYELRFATSWGDVDAFARRFNGAQQIKGNG